MPKHPPLCERPDANRTEWQTVRTGGGSVGFCPPVVRSYLGYYTGSHQNSAVKRLWAGIVLGWVTSREVPVSHPRLFFFVPLFRAKLVGQGGANSPPRSETSICARVVGHKLAPRSMRGRQTPNSTTHHSMQQRVWEFVHSGMEAHFK